ncbi:S41 family peptidase [Pareuzebyella sediminis]|uniref:S41 family peptidase n=1 Tax=Pareuzebyella sediminis TaxID=2607998 RepID=UPI0011ED8E71|nr:S41 family peptidase [Pareuzebyella sediminis]
MHRFFLAFLFLCLARQTSCSAQEFSQETKLASTAKIWGFLKYYHPQVAKGKFNWDEQLLKMLPKVIEAANKEALSKIYMDWINTLGKVKECTSCHKASEEEFFDKNFDLSWIKDSILFTTALSNKLKFIEKNRFHGKHHYIEAKYETVGNVTLKNEPEYPDFDWKDRSNRLLLGFKYWNVIEYFFPYKYQTDKPWNQVLLETIPKLDSVKTEAEFQHTLLQMVVNIDDAHGAFVSSNVKYKWPPYKLRYIDEKIVVSGYYRNSLTQSYPFQRGDVIVAVNDRPLHDIMAEKKPFVWGSNEASRNRNLANFIMPPFENKNVKVNFLRDGEKNEAVIGYYPSQNTKPDKPEKFRVIQDNIGYVNMGVIERTDVSKIMDSLKNTKAIIFDIRNYPKGTLYNLAQYLIPERRLFFKAIKPDLSYPGRFLWTNGRECGNIKGEPTYTGKIILLVNEYTQSHAEFTTMALQTADKVTTIGNQTAGADGNVSELDLGAGIKTYMSGIGIFYPDGLETQRIGVKIDIEVLPSIDGIKDNRDEVLERAIAFVNKGS